MTERPLVAVPDTEKGAEQDARSAQNADARGGEAEPFSTIIAPFTNCANCGSAAAGNATWNRTGGWTCSACGESDYPEAAE